MVLGAESEANNINLDINGVNIEQLKSIKLFGVFLDSELNFSEHISSVCRKASQQIGVLRRLRKIIPTHAKLQLYKAVILPHLTYCSTIWHFCRASDKRKVDRLQERALRVVFNNEPVSYDELLRLAELPSLFNRRLQEIAILNYVLRIVCAVLRLKLGEQTWLPAYSRMAEETACFVIINFETLCYTAKFLSCYHVHTSFYV